MLKYTDYNIVFQEIPNEVTLAINISNCPNCCNGCHSPWLMEDIGKELTEHTLHNLLNCYGSNITCVCFMGGDSNPKEVEKLALYTSHTFPQIKAGWYSGKDELPNGINPLSFKYIKLGGYIKALGGLNSKTTNQRLYAIESNGIMSNLTGKFWKP
ncbi:MAG: anaerobic ribonucleoside-triphosphate reductase activating protein [Bacteroidales bacterium]